MVDIWQADCRGRGGAGRVVIPKALRDVLGLTAGQPLEIVERDGRFGIVPAPTPMTLVDRSLGPPSRHGGGPKLPFRRRCSTTRRPHFRARI
ncbi:AbrB/MazE/SpoVT family DNA-binding domain-containing protein [Frankia sp. AiPa1]|uniref:AbrB/MazE/SpoVT family DNA-binding domain-containing protein n=1 Tax=Frankia sp. AiPa1 TaxID=573492 RepID=UPI0035A899B0